MWHENSIYPATTARVCNPLQFTPEEVQSALQSRQSKVSYCVIPPSGFLCPASIHVASTNVMVLYQPCSFHNQIPILWPYIPSASTPPVCYCFHPWLPLPSVLLHIQSANSSRRCVFAVRSVSTYASACMFVHWHVHYVHTAVALFRCLKLLISDQKCISRYLTENPWHDWQKEELKKKKKKWSDVKPSCFMILSSSVDRPCILLDHDWLESGFLQP